MKLDFTGSTALPLRRVRLDNIKCKKWLIWREMQLLLGGVNIIEYGVETFTAAAFVLTVLNNLLHIIER